MVIIHVGTVKNEELANFLSKLAAGVAEMRHNFIHIGKCDYPLTTPVSGYIHIYGHMPPEHVQRHMQGADIGIVYLSDTGCQGLVDQSRSSTKLFEYMRHGIIPLCSDVGEPRNLPGTLVAHNNVTSWLYTIKMFAESTEWLPKAKALIKSKYKSYSHENIMRKVLS